jgi:hypothetical protein
MAGFTNYAEEKVLDHLFRNVSLTSPGTVYLALFTVITDGEASTVTEVSGNGYARAAIAFSAYSGGSIANSAQIDFTASGGAFGTVVGIGIYDASTNGDLLAFGSLSASQAVNNGNTLRFAAASVTVSLD